jgi:hypothetical protein
MGRKWESRPIEPPSCRLVGDPDSTPFSGQPPEWRQIARNPDSWVSLSGLVNERIGDLSLAESRIVGRSARYQSK